MMAAVASVGRELLQPVESVDLPALGASGVFAVSGLKKMLKAYIVVRIQLEKLFEGQWLRHSVSLPYLLYRC
jgi:hypothetical protein